jgi:hypothetical protein
MKNLHQGQLLEASGHPDYPIISAPMSYLITSVAIESTSGGTSMPSARAV